MRNHRLRVCRNPVTGSCTPAKRRYIRIVPKRHDRSRLEVQRQQILQPADFATVRRPCFYAVAVEAMYGDYTGSGISWSALDSSHCATHPLHHNRGLITSLLREATQFGKGNSTLM